MNSQAIVASQNAIASRIDSNQASDLFHKLILANDLSTMTKPEQIEYYKLVCNRIGLDPYQKPFDLIKLSGKLTLYANKIATAQLTSLKNLKVSIVAREVIGDQYVVTARCETQTGGFSEDIGAVPIGGLKGDNASNAMKKAATQAKRRAILAACGLGMLDETEVSQVAGAVRVELGSLDIEDVQEETKVTPTVVNFDPDVVIDDASQEQILAFASAIESAETASEINELAIVLKQLSPIVKDNVRQLFVERVKTLKLIHTINGYVEPKNAKK